MMFPLLPSMHCDCRIVPERTAFVIERFGKYARTLQPGLHLLIPVVRTTTRLPPCCPFLCTRLAHVTALPMVSHVAGRHFA